MRAFIILAVLAAVVIFENVSANRAGGNGESDVGGAQDVLAKTKIAAGKLGFGSRPQGGQAGGRPQGGPAGGRGGRGQGGGNRGQGGNAGGRGQGGPRGNNGGRGGGQGGAQGGATTADAAVPEMSITGGPSAI